MHAIRVVVAIRSLLLVPPVEDLIFLMILIMHHHLRDNMHIAARLRQSLESNVN